MSDIRKDFDRWFEIQYPDPVPDYALHEVRIFKDNQFTAYQAGRAHDIEGVIAELVAEGWTIPAEIVRKHFGKE